jgi:hypothetical protein
MKTQLTMALPKGVALLLCLLAQTPSAVAADSFSEMFTEGKASVAFRYRYEHVDHDAFDENAKASTLRSRLNFETADLNGFSAFAEVDWVAEILVNDYNAGAGNTPDRENYPVVADPEGLDLNQAFLQFKNGGHQVRAGRQRIIYDNARFVGNVGWRQNEQTYDAGSYRYTAGNWDLQGAYIGQVNRIFGDDVPAGRHDTDTWTVNAAHAFDGVGKLSVYYYDIDNEDAAAFSTASYGIRFVGEHAFDSTKLGYTLEYARQNDAHLNPVDYSADYYRLDLSLGIKGFTPYVGYESLGGDDTRPGAAFRTPLATLHAFNGWADLFLTTPDAGLRDIWVGVKGKVGSWSWNALYHDFQAESGGEDFGGEFNASIGRNFADHYGVLLKVASFKSDTASLPDVLKFWVQFTASF